MTSTQDSSNFFRREIYDEDYWNNYLTARPYYDEAFYRSIYDYHESNGGHRDLAHDVGTGPGQVAAELSQYFKHVVASDNNVTHLSIARHRLDSSVASQRTVELVQCSAEALDQTYPPCSADMITAAECLPLTDAAKAIEGFASILKPNGTLAAWFYGRPVFSEPEYASRCQPILNTIIDMAFTDVIKGGGSQHQFGWKRATDCMASFLDDIELDSRTWQRVERRKWNSQNPMPFYGPTVCNFEVTRSSRVGEVEQVIEIEDRRFWERRWDLAGVKRFVQALLPTFSEHGSNGNIQRKYDELAWEMGGENAVRKITWPVVLVVASRK